MIKSVKRSLTNTWRGVKKGAQQRGKNPVNTTFWVFLVLFSSIYCFSVFASLLWAGGPYRQQWLDTERRCGCKAPAGPLCALHITRLQKGLWERALWLPLAAGSGGRTGSKDPSLAAQELQVQLPSLQQQWSCTGCYWLPSLLLLR